MAAVFTFPKYLDNLLWMESDWVLFSNEDPRLTIDLFMARSDLLSFAFVLGNVEKCFLI